MGPDLWPDSKYLAAETGEMDKTGGGFYLMPTLEVKCSILERKCQGWNMDTVSVLAKAIPGGLRILNKHSQGLWRLLTLAQCADVKGGA